MYLGSSGMKAQLKYADRRNSPAAIIAGSNEFDSGKLQVKDLVAGKEQAAAIARPRRLEGRAPRAIRSAAERYRRGSEEAAEEAAVELADVSGRVLERRAARPLIPPCGGEMERGEDAAATPIPPP